MSLIKSFFSPRRRDKGINVSEVSGVQLCLLKFMQYTDALFIEEGKDAPENSTCRCFGLGLRLSKEFINLNRGRFEVTSRVSEGTTFSVYLPLG